MSSNKIVVSKKLVYGVAVAVGILIFILLFGGKFSAFSFGRSQNTSGTGTVDSTKLVAGSVEKFAFLSGQTGQRSVGST